VIDLGSLGGHCNENMMISIGTGLVQDANIYTKVDDSTHFDKNERENTHHFHLQVMCLCFVVVC
jgi:hypothetical protein